MGITAQQFEELQARLGKNGRRNQARQPAFNPAATENLSGSVLLGIDPSLRCTGYGIVQALRPQPIALGHGTIRCPANWLRSRCLARIAEILSETIRTFSPTVCIVEGLFYAQNLQTALIMGEARGTALAIAAQAGLQIYEIAPRKVKQALVGYGAARKEAVGRMVQRLLNLETPPASDAADALALAIAHIQEAGRHRLTPLKQL